MEQRTESEQSWGVVCLHCRKPFPVPYVPSEPSDAHEIEAREERTLFLAWCPVCNREAPYAVGELVTVPGPRVIRARVSGRVSAFERVAGAS
ncbi:MAG: hypothetical protein KGL59_09485 [Acidobacteriota bacterium]|nr:hypothetical protein [Acidobacteriota bacterium]